jgi:O-antigen/teichoic acid export membrane protein
VKSGKKHKSYGRTAKRGALWSVIRQGGHEVMAIPMSMIMARLLTPREFGVTIAASFFVLLAARLTQFGFGAAVVRVKELREEHASSVFVVNMVSGLTMYLTLFVAAPFIGRFFNSPESGALVRVAALSFLVSPFGSVASALLSRRMEFRAIAIADWTDTFVGAAVTIVLALRGWSYWSVPWGHVVATTLRVFVQMYLARWRPSLSFSREAMRELLSYGMGVQSKRLLEYAAANVDTLVVGRVLDLTSLGFYDKAFSTMNRLVNRLTLGQAAFRIFSMIHEDHDRFARAYSRLVLGVTMLGYPIFLACIVAAGPLFEVMYGKQWGAAVLPFQLLCAGGMLKLLNAYGAQANEAAGAIWGQVGRQAIGSALVLIGASIGAVYGGIVGAAAGVAVAMLLLTVALQDLVRRATRLTWWEMLRPQLPALTCGACVTASMLAAQWTMQRRFPAAPAWQTLLAQGGAGALAYVVFVLWSPFCTLRDVVHETARDFLPTRFVSILARLSPGW